MAGVIVIIKDPEQHYEGLRTSLGLLLHAAEVSMVVLDHEVADMNEAYQDNMGFLDEMEGQRFSNNQENIDKYGFQPLDKDILVKLINQADTVIPF
ncbi:hypothetical protein [Desulfonatronovibrio hydrogenovorans]|uniref:hypothetical protein n=1 Tax=Desulfonatronovibrio hydrogenovorans TaxID=53245 RepID=UPI00048CFBD0|nr:hypothetical protein [Desulfonatronovibrio hydrogenovorans]